MKQNPEELLQLCKKQVAVNQFEVCIANIAVACGVLLYYAGVPILMPVLFWVIGLSGIISAHRDLEQNKRNVRLLIAQTQKTPKREPRG